MIVKDKTFEILDPIKQLNLYGYKDYFNLFISLYNKKKLPNVILFSGSKGLGKSTFLYHFINYLLSLNEKNKYLLNSFEINPENLSFKLINNETHPNFFLLKSNSETENTKVDQARNLLKFLGKTTYAENLKIVLIDNVEFLNPSASNALLKSLEEPTFNTFFFIIHNNAVKIADTIKSRCIEFKCNFNLSEKKNIFNQLIQNYKINPLENNIDKFLNFTAPGIVLELFLTLNEMQIDDLQDDILCISSLIEKYKKQNDAKLLYLITIMIENFFNSIYLKDNTNLKVFFNKYKILQLIDDMKKFNLDKKNLFITINKILKNAA